MVTAEELVVAIRSDGVAETEQDLEGVERAMDETADSAGDSASELEGFSERFSGAMAAAVSALAVGVAGILSQVPVIGEAGNAIGAVIGAFTRQLDDTLRPAVSGFAEDMYELAEAVEEADGPLEAFKIMTQGFGKAIENLAFGQIQKKIKDVFKLKVPKDWLSFGWDIITFNSLDALGTIVDEIERLPDLADGGLEGIGDKFNDKFDGITKDLSNWADGVVSDAKNWGENIIDSIISGIDSKADDLANKLENLINKIPGVDIDLPDLGDVGGDFDLGGDDGGNGGNGGNGDDGGNGIPFVGDSPSGGDGGVFSDLSIDGRSLTESTGRYFSDPSRRQGL